MGGLHKAKDSVEPKDTKSLPLTTAWEICPSCNGHGLRDGMDGPVNCWECNGYCTVRIRDSKGRYAVNDLEPSDD